MDHSSVADGALPTDARPNRFELFASFVKRYMGVAAIVTAAMPLGIAKLGAVPAYSSLEPILATYSSLFCFLTFAYVFFIRHSLARAMFGQGGRHTSRFGQLAPLLLFACALACGIGYLVALQSSTQAAMDQALRQGTNVGSMVDILKSTDFINIPYCFLLISLYLGLFVCAEGSFVLMATREYLQDVLGLDDVRLCNLRLPPDAPAASSKAAA